jgi:Rod binding domain-containing protein
VSLAADIFTPSRFNLPVNAFESNRPSNTAGLKSPQGQKLTKAAGEFEALLLQSLWKSMKDTFKSDGDPDSDPTLESYDDLGIQGLASAVGNAGGLGIKSMILKHLGPSLSGPNQGGPAPT